MQQGVVRISWGAIIGGVVLILLGSYLGLFQSMSGAIGDIWSSAIVAQASPEFLNWLRLLGILIGIRGMYLVSTSVFRSSTPVGLVIRIGDEVLTLLVIPLLLWLREHVELVPIVSIGNGQTRVDFPQGAAAAIARNGVTAIIGLIVLATAISLIRLFIAHTGVQSAGPSD